MYNYPAVRETAYGWEVACCSCQTIKAISNLETIFLTEDIEKLNTDEDIRVYCSECANINDGSINPDNEPWQIIS